MPIAQPPEAIPLSTIEAKLGEIRDLLKRDALVADLEFAEPTPGEIAGYEELRFVKQLRSIGLGSNRLGYAKQDFDRAFAQRSRWTRQHVVLDDELERFERMRSRNGSRVMRRCAMISMASKWTKPGCGMMPRACPRGSRHPLVSSFER